MEQIKTRYDWRKLPWKSGFLLALALLLLGWLFSTPPGLLGKADAVGYAVCHRIDSRSFHLGDRQLPLCARCSGMFLGGLLGIAYQGVIGRRRTGAPPLRVILTLAVFVVAFGVDGVNSYFHLFPRFTGLYEPANWIRLLTGTGMGLVVAIAIYPAFNQTVWLDGDPRPAVSQWRSLGVLVLLGLILDGLILTESPVILYPLAILSTLGVMVLMMMVYTIVLLMVFRQENRFTSMSQLALPLAAGFFLALLQISVLDFVRFWFTRTWGGFPGLG